MAVGPNTALLTIPVTREEQAQIEALARQHGYATPAAYLLALVKADAQQSAEQTAAELEDEFREGWHAAMTGQTIPADQLWDALNRDE
jgi:hypothetical protein